MDKEKKIQKNLTLIYWKGKKFWLGKLAENPEIMSQGRSLKELVENIKDAYYQMTLDEVPANYRTLDISV
ncbi:MAG: type II toxin-antitoxin system HicB family antitoxin [Candidatus Aminicenantes bacterium]|nr:type II toxin-antitoxin system HicB family antitoxin [Candidatus Aminicenantes bacterium]